MENHTVTKVIFCQPFQNLTYLFFHKLSADDLRLLNREIKTASGIIGVDLPPLSDIYEKRSLKRAHSIISDSTHPAHPLFELLPSGKRYRTLKTTSGFFSQCNTYVEFRSPVLSVYSSRNNVILRAQHSVRTDEYTIM